ncbi:MAG: oligosaccharide flippase family protein [Lachnospiraceae bacterium]|nr:oligosaccharide flippase family protein [Lachnospiraceae bacterium]
MNRTEKSIRNIRFGMGLQILTVLLAFINRTILIRTVGIELVGLGGLFNEVIGALSLAELGIGSSIAYSLYAPLARGDERKTAQLMELYRKAYHLIAGLTFLIGLLLLPFVHLLVRRVDIPLSYIRIVYLLYLIQLSSSYLFSYKTALLNVDQKNYIWSGVFGGVKIAGTLLQILLVLLSRNYLFYVGGLIFISLTANIICARIADRDYPCLSMKTEPLSKTEKKKIFSDIKNIFIKSLSGKITGSTDNILISTLISTAMVGYYSNYNMVFSVVRNFVYLLQSGLVNSVGNMMATESDRHSEEVFRRLSYIFNFFGAVFAAGIFACMEPFIRLWLGPEFLLPREALFAMSLAVYLEAAVRPLWMTMEVSGLFAHDKNAAILGSAVNLIVSICLGLKIGMAGIFIGTCLTYLLQAVLKAYYLYRLRWGKSPAVFNGRFLTAFAGQVILLLAAGAAAGCLRGLHPLVSFIGGGLISTALVSAFYYLLTGRTEDFEYMIGLIKRRKR